MRGVLTHPQSVNVSAFLEALSTAPSLPANYFRFQVGGAERMRHARDMFESELLKHMHQSRQLVDYAADGNVDKMRQELQVALTVLNPLTLRRVCLIHQHSKEVELILSLP